MDKVVLYVLPENLHTVTRFLKYNSILQCDQLLDIFGVDYINNLNRFEVSYIFLNLNLNIRVILKININVFGSIYSLVQFFPSAN